MLKAKLNQAWYWNCRRCGHHNYTEGVPAPLSPEEREAALREELGLEPYQSVPDDIPDDVFVVCPDEVSCIACKTMHRAEL
jgi:hypothetical protein